MLCLYLSVVRSGINLAFGILKLILQNIYDKLEVQNSEKYKKVLDLI